MKPSRGQTSNLKFKLDNKRLFGPRPKLKSWLVVLLLIAIAALTFLWLFDYFHSPSSSAFSITNITPNTGTTAGGTAVTITGDFNITTPTSLQTMTGAHCQAMPVYTLTNTNPASTITLVDTRNNQAYDIRKMPDGKCWMVDNLKLKLGVSNANSTLDTTVLEPSNTNVASNTTVSLASGGVSSGFTTSGYLTGDNTSATTNNNYEAWRQVDPSNTAGCQSSVSYNAASKSQCGYLYNFYTATAGTGLVSIATDGTQATGSICPAGWRLPSATSTATGPGNGTSYNYGDLPLLNAKMRNPAATVGSTDANYYATWQPNNTYRGTFSGMWSTGYSFHGTRGMYWSSTVQNSGSAHNLYFLYDIVQPGNAISVRHQGFAVRCVIGDGVNVSQPTVTFGGIPATDVSLSQDGLTITATTPAHAAGAVDVVVDHGSSVTLSGGFTYQEPIVTTIADVDPDHGPITGGTTVQITGSGFVAAPPPSPTSLQAFTTSYCNSMPIYSPYSPEPRSTISLTDTRNNQAYKVRRLEDGNCWMIDNLRLDNVTLTPSNSNVTANYTIPARVAIGSTSSSDPLVYGPVPGDDTAVAANNYGYLYNFAAATAGSGNSLTTHGNVAQSSICPSGGWRLPRAAGGTTSSSTDTTYINGDWAILNNSMYTGSPQAGSVESSYFGGWQTSGSFQGVFSGLATTLAYSGQGSSGYYWSSMAYSALQASTSQITDSQVYPGNTSMLRSNGLAVRCVISGSSSPPPSTIVKFDNIEASLVSLVDNLDGTQTATVTTPAHAAGAVSVSVGNGQSAPAVLANGYTYQDIYISIGLDASSLLLVDGSGELSVTPSTAGTFAVAPSTVTVKTNNPIGHYLTISTNSPTNNNLNHQSLSHHITATSGSWTTPASLGVNSWGFATQSSPTDDQAIWMAVPSSQNAQKIVDLAVPSEDPGASTTVYYGVKINLQQTAGKYAAVVVYTAVGNT